MSTPLSHPRGRVPRLADAAVERARLTVVPRRSRTARRTPFVTLVSLLLVGGVVGLLLFNTNMQQSSFVATSLEERAAVLTGKEESLRMQLHRLRDPQTVAARAKALGMVPSTNPAFLRLSDGKVLGKPAVAAPTEALRIDPPPPPKPESLRPRLVIAEVPKVRRGRGADATLRTQPTEPRSDTTPATGAASPEQAAEAGRKNRRSSNAAAQAAGRTRP